MNARQPRAGPGSVDALWRAALLLGGLAVVAGGLAVVLAVADGVGFAEPGVGTRVWWFHHANPLGDLLALAGGGLAVAAGLARSPLLTLTAGAALLAVGVGVPLGQALGPNLLGGSASTFALCLGLGGGLIACGATARLAER